MLYLLIGIFKCHFFKLLYLLNSQVTVHLNKNSVLSADKDGYIFSVLIFEFISFLFDASS